MSAPDVEQLRIVPGSEVLESTLATLRKWIAKHRVSLQVHRSRHAEAGSL